MVVLQHNTESDSNATEGDDTGDAVEASPDPSVVDRLVGAAEKVATVIEPFAALLTAVVQAATVATLVRQA